MLMSMATYGESSLGNRLMPEVKQVLASVQQLTRGMIDLLASYDRNNSGDNSRQVATLEEGIHSQVNQLYGYDMLITSREIIPIPGAFMSKESTDENKSKYSSAAAKQAESTQMLIDQAIQVQSLQKQIQSLQAGQMFTPQGNGTNVLTTNNNDRNESDVHTDKHE